MDGEQRRLKKLSRQ